MRLCIGSRICITIRTAYASILLLNTSLARRKTRRYKWLHRKESTKYMGGHERAVYRLEILH